MTCIYLYSQSINDTLQTDTSYVDAFEEEDFNPGIFILLLFSLVCLGIGIIGGIFILLLFAILVIVGIFSVSLITTLYTKSLQKGFKSIVIQFSIVSNIILCNLGMYLYFFIWQNKITNIEFSFFIYSTIIGIVLGVFSGMFFFFLIQKTLYFLKSLKKSS